MSDDDEFRQAAADQIRQRGPSAVKWLLEQAEVATELGDKDGAKVWRDVAAAAQSILSRQST